MIAAHNEIYQERRLFAREDKGLVLFVCFERLSDHMFAVSQAEFIRKGDDLSARLRETSVLTAELLLDNVLAEAGQFYPTIEEAIAAHGQDFANWESWTHAPH